MNGRDCEQLTLFREDFPASRFPWLESKRVKTTIVICGRKCSELSENLRRVGSSVRTYLESCELPPGTWSRTWSVRAMTSSCLLLKLRLSERRTDESASRLWPTAAARDYKGSNSMEHLTRQSGNRNHVDQLANAVKLFPTPRAQSAKAPSNAPNRQGSPDLQTVVTTLYPTPTTGAGLCGGTGNFQQLQKLKEAGTITEDERRQMSQGNGWQLNPDWVEWLMGLPVGWTSLTECQE